MGKLTQNPIILKKLIQNWRRNGIQPRTEILHQRILLLVAVKKFGGSAKITMNGHQQFLTDLSVVGAHIVLANLYVTITVCKLKILNCPRNGIQPKTEILHQRILPPLRIRKCGGDALKVMNGRLLLIADLLEPDAPFVQDYLPRKKITFRF